MAAALATELEKSRLRAEERRRRDPTFRPDAVALDQSKVRKFNKFIDYYEVLELPDHFASAAELKEAYKKLSLQLHPDKLRLATEDERVAAEEKYHAVHVAYDILTEPATRQLYDKARDKLEAQYAEGVVVTSDESTKPPPSCVDVDCSLEEVR